MKHHRLRRTALLTLSMVFLALAWAWDGLIAVERFVVVLIPWTRVKRAFVALVDFLPAPAVLLIFLVPLLVIEPLLVVATFAIAMGYVVSGAIAWIVLKLLAIAVLPAIFDLTQHRLMTMPWFARSYEKVLAFHHYADRVVAPYKRAAATRRGGRRSAEGRANFGPCSPCRPRRHAPRLEAWSGGALSLAPRRAASAWRRWLWPALSLGWSRSGHSRR